MNVVFHFKIREPLSKRFFELGRGRCKSTNGIDILLQARPRGRSQSQCGFGRFGHGHKWKSSMTRNKAASFLTSDGGMHHLGGVIAGPARREGFRRQQTGIPDRSEIQGAARRLPQHPPALLRKPRAGLFHGPLGHAVQSPRGQSFIFSERMALAGVPAVHGNRGGIHKPHRVSMCFRMGHGLTHQIPSGVGIDSPRQIRMLLPRRTQQCGEMDNQSNAPREQ